PAVVVNDLIAERLRNGRAWPLPASPVQAAAQSKAARPAFAADVDDGCRADVGAQSAVVERGHLAVAADAELQFRIRRRVQLQGVAIRADHHGLLYVD